jgi:hypothetical protein
MPLLFRLDLKTHATMDARLKYMSAMLIAGPSQAGKTTFVEKLIAERTTMFDIAPQYIHWFTGTEYEPPADLAEQIHVYNDGLPDSFDMVRPHDLVVLDDLMVESEKSAAVSNLFTRLVHHKPCTVIVITQNLYSAGKENRTRSLNSQYIVLFKSPRDASQIDCLSRQMYPGEKSFLTKAYRDAVSQRPFSYLFLDLHQTTHEALRVRARILPGEGPQIVYLPPSYKSL